MKKYYISAFALALLSTGCKYEDVQRYDPDVAQITFRSSSSIYSFKTNSSGIADVRFDVVGYPADVERTARFDVVADSTDAKTGMYEILDAKVPAGSYSGTLRVKMTNTLGDGFPEEGLRLYLRTATGGDFDAGPVDYRYHNLRITNMLAQPAEWANIRAVSTSYLGTYSTAYYAFIIEETGQVRFPFSVVGSLGADYPVWSAADASNFLMNLSDLLRKRNQRVGTPLIHDDGTAKGYEVVVGKSVYP